MSDGFRGIISAPSAPIKSSTGTATPASVTTGDVTQFSSLELAFEYFGNPVFPGAGDFLTVQLLWRDENNVLLPRPETLQITSQYYPPFTGKKSFVTTPVRAASLQVVSSAGQGDQILAYSITGSYRTVPNEVYWQDANNFTCSDLIVVSGTGTTLAPLASTALMIGGLASGPFAFSANVAFQNGGGATATGRFRLAYGDTGVGPPDVNCVQPTAVSTLAVPGQLTGFFLPRRPLTVLLTNTTPGGNSINSWNFAVVRNEP
jgi:hypothetical protein